MRLRWRTALLLALPFVIVAIGARAFVPACGDWLARGVRDAAAIVSPRAAPRRVPNPPPNPDAVPNAAPNANATPNATPTPTPNATPTANANANANADGNANGNANAKRTSPPDAGHTAAPPPGPLRIPADKVQRAIDDAGRSIRARTTYGPDGKPMGARVTGVNGAGLGLRDGDIIVAVDGKPTMDDDAATDAALSVVARGESILRAKLTRDGQPFDVTLELPVEPLDAGKDVR